MSEAYSKMYEGLFDTRAIYLSDQETASNIELLKSLNITAVLTVAKEIKLNYPRTVVAEHLWLPAIDKPQYDIETLFQTTFDFIDRVHQKRNVLIHCGVGVSRSATIFIAYLIKKHGYSLQSAFALAKKRRPIINPNKGFIKALEKYSDKYSDKRAMSKQDSPFRHTSKMTGRSLQKKLSLRDECQRNPIPQKRQQESTKESQIRHSIEDIDNLKRVLEEKERIESKLKKLQNYYHNRTHKNRHLPMFNSCYQTVKGSIPQNFIEEFAKNSSSQL